MKGVTLRGAGPRGPKSLPRKALRKIKMDGRDLCFTRNHPTESYPVSTNHNATNTIRIMVIIKYPIIYSYPYDVSDARICSASSSLGIRRWSL